jgi:hypothetical protein
LYHILVPSLIQVSVCTVTFFYFISKNLTHYPSIFIIPLGLTVLNNISNVTNNRCILVTILY